MAELGDHLVERARVGGPPGLHIHREEVRMGWHSHLEADQQGWDRTDIQTALVGHREEGHLEVHNAECGGGAVRDMWTG